jgi:cytochrome c-type biogenesis protein CcmE
MRLIIGGAIIILVVGWLIYSNIEGSTAYYLTVEDLMAGGPSERMVRVSGFVVDQTIDWDPQEMTLRFEITDESGRLPVLYKGIRPDMLQDGVQAVVEGRYATSGVFEATAILLKCPSKYVEE